MTDEKFEIKDYKQEVKTLSNYELREAIDRTHILYKETASKSLSAIYLEHIKSLLAEQADRAESREVTEIGS